MSREPSSRSGSEIKPPSRRQILKGLALTSLVSSSTAAMATSADADEAPATDGTLNYRETDHIRRFYRLARR